ncbi:MAG: hypothetical protein KAX49_08270 [Halanaerobiales bacterium]|nr:hypothetical protein [Halanaerobiales bacterium]
MAIWKVIEIEIEALTKLHFGGLKLGVVELTKRFIPGKTLWGALTATLTREMNEFCSSDSYEKNGKILMKYFRFTNCYIKEDESVLVPTYMDSGLQYIKCPSDKNTEKISDYIFDQKFIGSYTSTAIDSETMTAKERTLHEIEYIKPKTRFCGYLLFREEGYKCLNIEPERFERILNEKVGLQGLGGNRSRGFGKVKIKSKLLEVGDEFMFFDRNSSIFKPWRMNLNSIEPKIVLEPGNQNALLPIQIDAPISSIMNFCGDIEPVVGRIWDSSRGAGQKLSSPQIILSPGSRFNIENKMALELQPFGTVKFCSIGGYEK